MDCGYGKNATDIKTEIGHRVRQKRERHKLI